jgi:uncharacterized protein with HEPN domain
MSTRDPVAALEDMRDAILTIESYTQGYSYEEYQNDKKTQDAVIRNFEILGEAATHVPDDIRASTPDIPWTRVIGLRNTVIHHYFGIDHATVWFILQKQLPPLREQVISLLSRV